MIPSIDMCLIILGPFQAESPVGLRDQSKNDTEHVKLQWRAQKLPKINK